MFSALARLLKKQQQKKTKHVFSVHWQQQELRRLKTAMQFVFPSLDVANTYTPGL